MFLPLQANHVRHVNNYPGRRFALPWAMSNLRFQRVVSQFISNLKIVSPKNTILTTLPLRGTERGTLYLFETYNCH